MARVKCRDTGEYSTSNIAYKDPKGKYWSSEDAYLKAEKDKEWRKKCIDLLFEVLAYPQKAIVPGFLFKRLKDYGSMGYDVVYKTIEGERPAINRALETIDFHSENGKLLYICKILEGHMMDYYKIAKAEQRVEQDISIPVDTDIQNNKQTTKDISRFLEND